uniref:IFT81 calponin homology domain-containing protein n=1 Tax=Takifugu rubripes TaxID=31033 RepID=A0A674MYH7_TAKRU
LSDQIKESIFIVNQLNKEPFLKNLTFPSFEALSPLMLLEVLNEVLTEIQPKYTEIIQDKTDEERVQEMINLLSMLEYEPIKECCDLQAIREGLDTNDKVVIYPILFWLLQDVSTLKRKAYLSQFTCEIEVPEFLHHDETLYIYSNKQKEQIQKFQQTFVMYEDLQPLSVSKNNAVVENRTMQNNKCSLLKQKEMLHKELESLVKSPDILLKASRQLRLERERAKLVARQTTEQEEQLSQAQKRVSELEEQTKGHLVAGDNAADLIVELKNEIEANTVKVMEKLPTELEKMRKEVDALQKLAEMPVVTAAQLLEMKNQIQDVTSKIHKRTVKIIIDQSCEEDRLKSIREKASAIHQTNNLKAQELQDLKDRLAFVERKAKVSATQTRFHDAEWGLWDELKCKKINLRKKYEEVDGLKAERAHLQGTERVLKQTARYFHPLLQILEAEKDKTGPSDVQRKLERMAFVKKKDQSQTDMCELRRLKAMMASLTSYMSTLREERKAVRQQALEDRFELKRAYGTTSLNDKLKLLKDENAELERQCNDKQALIETTKMKLKAAMFELKAYNCLEARDHTPKSVKAKGTEPRSRTNKTK